MTDLCNSPTSTGHSCGYPPNTCPLHIRAWPTNTSETHPSEKFDRKSLGPIAQSVVVKLTAGAITPLEAIRWLRAIHIFHDLPMSTEDEDDVLAEIELRGVVMNGFPPRNDEEWELAKKVFDADAITEFHRWEAAGRGW